MFESFKAIITEVDGDGVSKFRSREAIDPVFVRTPLDEPNKERTGTLWQIWGTPDGVASLQDPAVPVLSPGFPGPGGTRFSVFAIPPDSWATDRSELPAEASGDHLGIAGSHETDGGDATFHATDSIDYLCVIKGELVLELDDGQRETLVPGSCVVQRGTRHAWRNVGTEPAVLVSVLVGAHTGGSDAK